VADAGSTQTDQSGLFWSQWKHRLAVKLDFRPIGDVCDIDAQERQLQGSELIAGAVASWQPEICGAVGGDAYTVLTSTESDAAGAANSTVPGPMALTSRALQGDIEDDLQYAPVGLTGVAVSFAIDRQPSLDGNTPQQYLDKAKLPFDAMNLTPRLVAKLLTSSYLDALPYDADRTHLTGNPRNITKDPDFLAINDAEWKYQSVASPAIADALVPQGRSDAAYEIWSYVMADQDARDFLDGKADPWGMKVNKWSSDSATVAPKDPGTGASFAQTYPTDSFPKADPVEVPAQDGKAAINTVTWRPFTNDLDTSAYKTLRGDGQVLGAWNPVASPPSYDKSVRDLPGNQAVIGITDAASAEKYLTVTAALRNPAGKFVKPTVAGFTAAAAAMTASATQKQVVAFDNGSDAAKAAADAYPLTMPVYAAANPGMTDKDLRASYAAFIRYAVSAGAQTPGVDIGSLPAGYAPLPATWRTQALAAAAVIESGVAAPAGGEQVSDGGMFGDGGLSGGSTGPDLSLTGNESGSGGSTGDPSASGALAGSLSSAKTPGDGDRAGLDTVVPLSLLAGFVGAVAVAILGRIRRRI
jgi:hypothetical protein